MEVPSISQLSMVHLKTANFPIMQLQTVLIYTLITIQQVFAMNSLKFKKINLFMINPKVQVLDLSSFFLGHETSSTLIITKS